MPRPAHVPPELVGAPFTSGMALAAGLTRSRLRSKCWRRLFRDVYVHVSVPDTQELRIAAVRLIAPLHAVISGLTAAWIYGVDLRHRNRLDCEVTVEKGRGLDPRPGLRVRHGQLPDKDLFHFDGVVVMSPERTALDLAKRGPLTERVVALDAMLHAGVVDRAGLRAAFAGRRRWRGIRGAREALDHADGRSESPMESRLRMLLVLAGAAPTRGSVGGP